MEYIQGTLFGKMFPEHSAVTKDETSPWSSESSQGSSSQVLPMCLSLKKDGLSQAFYWSVAGGALLIELTTRNTGESPNAVVESHLSQILEDNPHPKYYLSAKAVIGILRRANKKGKQLPEKLEKALYAQSGLRKDTYGQKEITNAGEILRILWEKVGEKTFIEWVRRTIVLVQTKKILLCEMRKCIFSGEEKNDPCAICGRVGYTEVHHKDKNPLNNSPENLVRLCKSCHAKQHRKKSLCIVCGQPVKGHHLCTKHWQAWRRSNIRGWDTPYTAKIKEKLRIALERQARSA